MTNTPDNEKLPEKDSAAENISAAEVLKNTGKPEDIAPLREKKDIFDRLFMLPFFRIFATLYYKHREIWLYLFFGAVTTAVNFVVFLLLRRIFGFDEHTANIIAWCIAVLTAFFTNRHYVFQSESRGTGILYEFFRFAGSRVGTLLFEEAAILIFVTWLSLYDVAIKLFVAIFVIVLNYLFSRFLVFYKKEK